MSSKTAYRAVVRVGVTVGILMLAGCDNQPPPAPAPAAPPADSEDQNPTDLTALKSFVSEQGGPAGRGSAAMPAGHPPIEPPKTTQPAADGAAQLPPGHPTLPGAAAKEPAAPAMPPMHAPLGGGGELKYDPPLDWKPLKPTSAMRKAQFLVPRAGDDGEDGSMIVFYFGAGEGGNKMDNLARWKSMFSTADGKPIGDDAATQETFEANGLHVTVLDVTGNYLDAMAGVTSPKSNFRMLAAMVETPKGPWFFKTTGPAATMEQNRPAFRKMLESVRE